jgi:predicted metalloprotease
MVRFRLSCVVVVVGCLSLTLAAPAAASGGSLEQAARSDDIAGFVETTTEAVDRLWADLFALNELDYDPPSVVLIERDERTDCGKAEEGEGSFYCPRDQTVYLDVESLEALREEFGPVAAVVVVAHQWGYHVAGLTGTRLGDEALGRPGDTDDRLALQADCWSGLSIFVAEHEGLLDYGAGERALAFLLATAEATGAEANPGADRTWSFLQGYYAGAC